MMWAIYYLSSMTLLFNGLMVVFSFQDMVHHPVLPVWPAADGAQSPHVEGPVDEEGPLEEAPLEPIPVSARKKKVVADLHSRLASRFPSHFHQVEEVLPYYEIRGDPPSPSLILEPDLSRTWFRPPVPHQDDTVGYWPKDKCKLPPTRRTLFPPTTKSVPLGRTPYYYVSDERLRAMLEATSQRDKVPLDLKAFDVPEVSVKNVPQAALDVHLRKALLECYTTDAYMQLVYALSQCATGASQEVSQVEALELLPGVVRQAAMANARSGQSLSAGFVGNVVALRDVVLGRFTVPTRTEEVLRGGDFTGDSLFAPLPESFSSLLDTVPGAQLRCLSKSSRPKPSVQTSSTAPTVPAKRPASSGLPPAKLPRSSQAPRGRGQSFHRKPASRGSRAGRF